ncbi:MAG TPA: hypothetical protein VJW51_10520 [Candidatus Acidoferrales bacterium]|nr:hypothetical protein [Candidatus Acidoferrales bacterium]
MVATARTASGGEGLRPLELTELLDRTFTLYRRNFTTFLMICGVPYLLVFVLTFSFGLLMGGIAAQKPADVAKAAGALAGIGMIGLLIGIVLYLIAHSASQAAAFCAVSETYLGRPITFGGAYRQARGKIVRLVFVAIYVGLATGIGFVLLIIPGIIVLCRCAVALPASILENLGPRGAANRSWALTKGFAGRALVVYFLTFVLGMVAALTFQFPFTFLANLAKGTPMAGVWNVLGEVGQTVGAILVAPIGLIAFTILYYDLRIRKEAFDLQHLLSAIGPGGPR